MNPAPKVLLLDSCSYFRLARSIHPLLAGSFGPPPPYSLFVLAALDDEYLTNPRLQNKFEWVNAREYKQDREIKKYQCKGKWAKEAEVLEYLDHENDLPMGKPKLRQRYQELFGQPCPLEAFRI
jgi:hypothetical protein